MSTVGSESVGDNGNWKLVEVKNAQVHNYIHMYAISPSGSCYYACRI